MALSTNEISAAEIEHYFDRLWPLNRSITGDGVRESLEILSELIDLEIYEVPSGTECFDWIVPPEWNVKDAWIKNSAGKKIVNFTENNLHLMGYSVPFKGALDLSELKSHLYTLPELPNAIPYRTSYYERKWGFCLSYKQYQQLEEDTYTVYIDSELNENGSMTYGEAILPGKSKEEFLLSTYVCHPSMANNELSGPLVTAFLYRLINNIDDRRYTYRFLFLPETIGAICYLSKYGDHLKKVLKAGYVVTCAGDDGIFNYKKSRQGNTIADKAAELALEQIKFEYNIHDFFPYGSDERQYCSSGFNLPVGSLMRSMYSNYPEYHTSEDNKSFISFLALSESIKIYFEIIKIIENNKYYLNTNQYCEPFLSNKGIQYLINKNVPGPYSSMQIILWLLNFCDGEKDLIEISQFCGVKFDILYEYAQKLTEKDLLELAE